jgi:hypothetical protein
MEIKRLPKDVPGYRVDEINSLLEFHDLQDVLAAMLRYMPEANFSLMTEELRSETVSGGSRKIFEEGGLPGSGALKILVGKGPDNQLTPDECVKIGKIIASMRGVPRQYYVGMMNFLGSAKRIYDTIHDAYVDEIRKQAEPGAKPSMTVPSIVNTMFPGKTMPTEAEIKKREQEEMDRLATLKDTTNQKIEAKKAAQEAAQPNAEEQKRAVAARHVAGAQETDEDERTAMERERETGQVEKPVEKPEEKSEEPPKAPPAKKMPEMPKLVKPKGMRSSFAGKQQYVKPPSWVTKK